MSRPPQRVPVAGRRFLPPAPMLHLEFWVGLRKDRARLSAILRRVYGVARPITQAAGGSGPWVFLVDPDPPHPTTRRLRATLGLRADEDLWVELAFYPSKTKMRSIVRRIWKEPRFVEKAAGLDQLVSRRKAGYDATLAHARLKPV